MGYFSGFLFCGTFWGLAATFYSIYCEKKLVVWVGKKLLVLVTKFLRRGNFHLLRKSKELDRSCFPLVRLRPRRPGRLCARSLTLLGWSELAISQSCAIDAVAAFELGT